MAKTKSSGTTRLGRDSKPKYLGLKVGAGQKIKPGMMIVKQRGTNFFAGKNVKKSSDDSLYAVKEGIVRFRTKQTKRFDGTRRESKIISVE